MQYNVNAVVCIGPGDQAANEQKKEPMDFEDINTEVSTDAAASSHIRQCISIPFICVVLN